MTAKLFIQVASVAGGDVPYGLIEEAPAYGPLVPFVLAITLALVHLCGVRLEPGAGERYRRWLSVGSGASVAYVFVLLLPEVSEAALTASAFRDEALLAEQRVYILALVGFVAFYGIEVFVSQSRGESVEDAPAVFWFHLVVFTLYSALIGYLLFHQEAPDVVSLAFYALAMALHFLVTDNGLRRHHGTEFDRVGRWVLALGTLAGAVLGVVIEVSEVRLSLAFGFVAGALVLNIFKKELPDADEGRFAAFAAGAAAYTILILFAG